MSPNSELTSLTVIYARDLADEHILVNVDCHGFIATDLNGFHSLGTPAAGAKSSVRMATTAADGPTGTSTDEAGTVA